MQVSEIERLYTIFDSKGVQIDEDKPPTPTYWSSFPAYGRIINDKW